MTMQEEEEEEFKPGTVLFTQGNTIDADVWDDSDLIANWEKTYEKYKKYANPREPVIQPPFQQTKKHKVKQGYVKKDKQKRPKKKTSNKNDVPRFQAPPPPPQAAAASTMPPMPPMPTSSNQEDLSNLMMAWYYCGYYTGLYQAQQR